MLKYAHITMDLCEIIISIEWAKTNNQHTIELNRKCGNSKFSVDRSSECLRFEPKCIHIMCIRPENHHIIIILCAGHSKEQSFWLIACEQVEQMSKRKLDSIFILVILLSGSLVVVLVACHHRHGHTAIGTYFNG